MSELFMPTFAAAIADRGSIDEHAVQQLRYIHLGKRRVDRGDVETLLALDRSVHRKVEPWNRLLSDAFVQHLVLQSRDGVVDREAGRWFSNCIERRGVVDNARLYQCLFNVIEQAKEVPGFLVQLALKQICLAVLHATGPLANERIGEKAVIGSRDVDLIRRLVLQRSGRERSQISAIELECLFDLHDRTSTADNHPAWWALLVEVVGRHVVPRLKKSNVETLGTADNTASEEAETCWDNLVSMLRSVLENSNSVEQRLRAWLGQQGASGIGEGDLMRLIVDGSPHGRLALRKFEAA